MQTGNGRSVSNDVSNIENVAEVFMDKMIARFCVVWLAYWLVFLAQPVKSVFPNVGTAWLVQLSFVIAVTVSFLIVQQAKAPHGRGVSPMPSALNTPFAVAVVKTGYVVSLIGLILLVYDKIVLQGIDYSSGIAVAREQWRIVGEDRGGGASSIYSAIGYIIGSAYFLSLAIVFSRNMHIPDRQRFRLMMTGLLLLLANSLITGGRSGVLLAVVFVSYALFSGDRRQGRRLFNRWKYRVIPAFFLGIAFTYALFIFGQRAAATDVDLAFYSLGFLNFLGLEVYQWFEALTQSISLGWLLALINLAVAYLTHSFASMAAIVNFEGGSEVVVFGYLMSLLAKLGLVAGGQDDWFLSGRLPSLPGGLYHQFGFLGMLLFGLFLGSLGGWMRGSYKWRRTSVSAMFYCCVLESILLMSPFLFVGDFLFFPFLIIGGVMSLALVGLTRRTAAQ